MREGERQKMRSETLQRGPATAGQGSQWTGASGELGFEASPDWTHFSDESLWLLLWEWTKAGEEAKTGAEETEEATAVIQVRDESSLHNAGRTGDPPMTVESNRKRKDSSFLTRTQPMKSHGLTVYYNPPVFPFSSINECFFSWCVDTCTWLTMIAELEFQSSADFE